MTGISNEMKDRIRESVGDLATAEVGALVPIKDMSPHYMSLNGDHPENGLMKLFPVEVDGATYYVYLKQS